LALSIAYLIWAFGAREYVESRVTDKLARQNVSYSQFISSPAPFTTFLWRIVGIDKDRYFETYFSLFDGERPLFINHYPRNLDLMKGLEEHPPVIKMQWFTRGYYALERAGEHIVIKDLRMGSGPDYVFRFKVAEARHPLPTPIKDERLRTRQDWRRRLAWVWKRIWNPIPFSESDLKRGKTPDAG
jgi:inner membrane protein